MTGECGIGRRKCADVEPAHREVGCSLAERYGNAETRAARQLLKDGWAGNASGNHGIAGNDRLIRNKVDRQIDLDCCPRWRSDGCRENDEGAVAELVGIEVGVVSGVINLESSGVEASDWRLRHEATYHET